MKILTYPYSNSDIEIIEINGELTGRGAVKLQEFLYSSMDEGRLSKIINLKHMKKADGLGLNVLENFINRGMRIRLFNAGLEVLNLLKISGKECIIKLYNCQETHEAVLMLEKEILEEKNTFRDSVKRRCFKRIDTSIKTEFKSHTPHNGEITYKAVIENISQGGGLVNLVSAFNKKLEECKNTLELVGKKLNKIKFSLNGGSRLIETKGECVWENIVNEDKYAGVRFKNMKQSHNEMIMDYAQKQKNS
ncbi:MAG: hypothetical protein GY777_15365 [Candidatus Brocadiaceae bacterium]|nr:hypothetical protein [Candidatus Brocadiaceae bacterium]